MQTVHPSINSITKRSHHAHIKATLVKRPSKIGQRLSLPAATPDIHSVLRRGKTYYGERRLPRMSNFSKTAVDDLASHARG